MTDYNELLSIKIDKIMFQIKSNMDKILSFQSQIKRKENLLFDSINKNQIRNTIVDRKPFHIGPINMKPKTRKMFDYQKYLKDFEKK